MKILIVGLGHIAHRHIKNIKSIFPSVTLGVWHYRKVEKNLNEISSLIDASFFSEEEALNWYPDSALITTPASLHLKTALPLANQGVHLFIEKPISHSLEDTEKLLEVCKKNKSILFVGYNFRFYPLFHLIYSFLKEGKIGRPLSFRAEVGQFLADWRPSKDYRYTASAKKELGGGVLLELSHELDFLRWLGGEVESVCAFTEHLSDLEIDVEDSADLILKFSSGALGSVHLDMIDRATNRSLRIVGTEGTITWDGIHHEVKLFCPKTQKWSCYLPPDKWEPNQMYIDEISFFLDAASSKTIINTHAEEALKTLKLVEAAKKSSETKKTVHLYQ